MTARPIITRPQAPLLDRARLLDQIAEFEFGDSVQDRWVGSGVSWESHVCGRQNEVVRAAAANCANDFHEDDPIRTCVAHGEAVAFTVKDRLVGSNLELEADELTGRLREAWREMTSWVFANVLTSSVAGVGTLPSTATAPAGIAFGSAVTPLYNALANIEAEFGARLFGVAGSIFLTPGLLANAVTHYGVEWRDGSYRTPAGNLVISDPGFYNADAPTGQAASAAGSEWVYASGPVMYRSSMPKFFESRQRPGVDRNVITAFVDSFGILVFDACAVTAVLASYDPDEAL